MTGPPRVLAVDPGGERCGIVVRRGDDLLTWSLVERGGETSAEWAEVVLSYVDELIGDRQPDVIAIEGVGEPNPHLGMINVAALLDTAVVFGAFVATIGADTAVIVEPAGFSKAAQQPRRIVEQLFPQALCAPPLPRLKDVRSAWLIAERAALQHRAVPV